MLVHSQRLNLSLHGDKISLCLRTLACADAGGIIYVTATDLAEDTILQHAETCIGEILVQVLSLIHI